MVADVPDAQQLRKMKADAVRPALMLGSMGVLAFFGAYGFFWLFLLVPVYERLKKRWYDKKTARVQASSS